MEITINLPDENANLAQQFMTEIPEQERNNALYQFIKNYMLNKKLATSIDKVDTKNSTEEWAENLPPITKKYFGYFKKNQSVTDKMLDDIKYQYLLEKHGSI